MLLSRLGRLCVVLPLVRWFSAVIGPKLDPSFLVQLVIRRFLNSQSHL